MIITIPAMPPPLYSHLFSSFLKRAAAHRHFLTLHPNGICTTITIEPTNSHKFQFVVLMAILPALYTTAFRKEKKKKREERQNKNKSKNRKKLNK